MPSQQGNVGCTEKPCRRGAQWDPHGCWTESPRPPVALASRRPPADLKAMRPVYRRAGHRKAPSSRRMGVPVAMSPHQILVRKA